ncbi:farnesyl pyrophosphate synthase-like [Phlebotomus papatasi]|uniref:farnesyl pyrophosphate synthase-like n=1 Tax=Phlebotomus papatasi TaxID=29031 RepID=UPI002483579B|nr:farnesyl pyrophosphate synthase-like [Phlebotomus papatasi]
MKKNVLSFTMDKYMSIAEYKAGYCYYVPITSAFHLAGYTNPEIFNNAKAILFELGCFAQIQNDFYDCFYDPNESGKNETDIQTGKSTWLIVTCLQRATAAQKKVLEECYGKNDPECVRRVKQIYEELSIPDFFAKFEKDTYNNIMMHIEKTDEIPAEVYLETVNELFTRGK